MGLTDVIVIAVVAVLLALAVRSVVRGKAGECSSCGSRGSCSAHETGAPCPAARDMLRNVEKSLGPRPPEG
ncbi:MULTISPECIES: FeoB-associated Cys-rich membrane protein [Atopobiaceae]|uniref:FeoB-associated Cys-rich membrane protein n=1 Tax=Atopobiaceae TaxID=1643824 RepID=UPI000B3A4BF5|nr:MULTISPECIES: FeoB-associated Cys-rich membrane protein [Atopobiaceae]MCR8908539.1 FeoB-associated Cys-rich membrane protein [Thermophilibacter sp. ET337]OUO33291.1 hypothetical protein B5F85_02260 [Olsenella sp. An293]